MATTIYFIIVGVLFLLASLIILANKNSKLNYKICQSCLPVLEAAYVIFGVIIVFLPIITAIPFWVSARIPWQGTIVILFLQVIFMVVGFVLTFLISVRRP